MDKILNAYLVCALWSSTDEEGNPLDDNFGLSDLSENTKAQAMADIQLFLGLCEEEGIDPFEKLDSEQVGHDIWLTRNGHGAGFWDRGLGEHGSKLSDIAKSLGSCDIYAGDNNELFFF